MLISITVLRNLYNLGTTYSDLEIHHFLRERRHLIVEAEPILAFLCPIKYHLLCGSVHNVIDIEGAAGLDLELFN
jgi:hypothetical protein